MSANLIPAIGLLLLMIVSAQPGKKASEDPQPGQANIGYRFVDQASEDEESDYQAIYTFITTTFKRISKEDAKAITTYLISFGKKHEIDPKFAAAVIARESGFNKKAISSTGAKGLGQIKDFNYQSLGIDDPYDIGQNVSGTTAYLKRMLGKWKANSEKVKLALASYYKGYGAVSRAGGEMDAPTQGYVTDILSYYEKLSQLQVKLKEDKVKQTVNIAK